MLCQWPYACALIFIPILLFSDQVDSFHFFVVVAFLSWWCRCITSTSFILNVYCVDIKEEMEFNSFSLLFFFQESEMYYPFLLYIMQYLKFQLIKKQAPSTPPKAVFYPPPACSHASPSHRLCLLCFFLLSENWNILKYLFICLPIFISTKE